MAGRELSSMDFDLSSDYQPRGDQVTAIQELLRGIEEGKPHQVLLGVTGSGKTFTVAKVIEAVNRPTLILAHNKTLAAQLYHEFHSFFPRNAVEYFVSQRRLHREGSDHQRRAGQAAHVRHSLAFRASRLRRGGQRELHLWLGVA